MLRYARKETARESEDAEPLRPSARVGEGDGVEKTGQEVVMSTTARVRERGVFETKELDRDRQIKSTEGSVQAAHEAEILHWLCS